MTTDEIPVHESTRRRRRWGCTCGCLVIVLFLLTAFAGLLVYLVKPVALQSQTVPANATADGYGLLRLDTGDDGVGALTNTLLKRIAARMKQQVPEKDRTAVGASMTVARKSFDQFVHPDVNIALSRDPSGEERTIAGMQFRNRLGVILANLYLNNRLRPLETGETTETAAVFYQLSNAATQTTDPAVIALVGRTLLISDSVSLVWEAEAAGGTPPGPAGGAEQLQPLLSALGLDQEVAGRDFAFAALTPPGRLDHWIHSLEKSLGVSGLSANLQTALTARKVDLKDIDGITVSGDIVSEDKITLTATLYGKQIERAKRLADALRLALNQWLQRAEGAAATAGLSTKVDVKALGTSVAIGLEINGIRKLIDRYLPPPPPDPTPAPAPAEAAP